MLPVKAIGKDHYSAVLVIVLGVFMIMYSSTYQLGNLTKMGAGFFPMVLGVLMLLTGVAIGLTATPAIREEASADSDKPKGHGGFEWRSWSCILGGLIAFIVFANYGGMVLASFVSVFVAAMGDRQNDVKHAALIGAFMSLVYIGIFYYGLKLPPPLFQWG